MKYATLGKTGLNVSRLGFGAMRLPMENGRVDRSLAIPMLHRAFEAGVNYVDTAVGYCSEDSQRAVGEALRGWRDRVVVSTKNPYYGESETEWWQNLENSLERLQVSYLDIYNTHGVNGQRFEEAVRPRIAQWMLKARNQGLIRHISTSFHDGPDILRKIVEDGFYESITLQSNMLDRKLEDAITYAREKNVGIVVMGPVAGGRLGTPNEVLLNLVPGIVRIPELALRFVLSNPNVTVALSGMSSMQQVEENLAVASDVRALEAEDTRLINEQLDRLKQMADTYCTGCDYCLPCPEEVNISRIFKMFNDARVYGLRGHAQEQYASWIQKAPEGGETATACIECGECEAKCPQHIPIRKQLQEAHEYLTTAT